MKVEEVTAEAIASNNGCAIATDRYHRIALWRQLFTLLIFLVAVAMVVFLVLCIVFATNEEWAATTATGLGTVAGGVPLRWVLKRRAESVKEEEKAFREAKSACKDEDTDLREISSHLKFV